MDSTLETPVNAQPEAPASSQAVSEDKSQLKQLLAEARNTREMLLDFETAVKNASFQGHAMLPVAKGMAFLQAILAQNKGHIDNLQDRLGK